MKKTLEIISWVVFWIATFVAAFASICGVGGVLTFITSLFNLIFADAFAFFAVGFFGSIVVLCIVCLLVHVYCVIEKMVKKKS